MKVLKVLTLTQPWATLVMLGEKNIETRSWSIGSIGSRVVITHTHCGKGF